VSLLAVGCSSFSSSPDGDVSDDLDQLKSRVLELQQRAAMDEIEIRRLGERVEELETGGRAPSPRTESTARGIGEEDLVPIQPRVGIESSDLGDDLGAGAETSLAKPGSQRVTADAQALYDSGYTLYHQGRYLDAEEAFTAFLASWSQTDLGDNAQYWIGESRLGRGESASALAAFRETVSRYPESNKAPDALYKVGRVLESLGDLDGARREYQAVASRYPGTAAARSAADHLRDL
jgi:tol-pal system protein YbgF